MSRLCKKEGIGGVGGIIRRLRRGGLSGRRGRGLAQILVPQNRLRYLQDDAGLPLLRRTPSRVGEGTSPPESRADSSTCGCTLCRDQLSAFTNAESLKLCPNYPVRRSQLDAGIPSLY